MNLQVIDNLKISKRLIAGFVILLLLMVMLLAIGASSLMNMHQRIDTIVNDNNVKTELTQHMRFFARHEAVIIRNVLLLRDAGQKEKEVGRRAEAQANYAGAEDKLAAMKHDEKSRELLEKLLAGKKATRPLWDKVVQLGLANKPDEGMAMLLNEVRKVQWQWLDGLDDLARRQSDLAKASADEAIRSYRRALTTAAVTGAAALALSFLIALLLSRSIVRPLASFEDNLSHIAQGDLTTTLNVDRGDEFGDLAKTVNGMTQSYDKIITNLMTTSNELVDAVSELRIRTFKTADGAKKQSGQASQIATSAEEMSQTITDISKNAAAVAESATSAKDTATEGRKVTDDAVAKVNSVYTSTVELAGRVEQLNKSIGEISDIVSFITGIADQTNLLALNAAIEAARAGEQGRGFAVVADEVRKLAERTIKATTEISDKIGAVQKESSQTAEVMGATSAEVTSAKEFIAKVGGTLQSVVNSIQMVSDQITRIAAAVEEQSAASEDVAKNIEQTSHIAGEMEAMSGEVMHEMNHLTIVAEHLRSGTSGFTTSVSHELIFDLAKTDHRIFVDKVGACLNNDVTLDPASLPTHETCRLGKWYEGEGRQRCGTSPLYAALNAPHTRIHALAKDAVAAHLAGDAAKADRLYQEMAGVSHDIAELLDRLKHECASSRSSAGAAAPPPAGPITTSHPAAAKRTDTPRPQAAGGTAMEWSDKYSVNVAEMDAQHKKLFALINELREAMRSGKGREAAGEILQRLVEYAVTHLGDEEHLMQKYEYPGYTGQKIAHDNLKKKVADYVEKFKNDKVTTVEIMNFLKDWLINHIQGSDKKYGPYFNSKGIH
jgi:methyl-accepting chemotaxis protein